MTAETSRERRETPAREPATGKRCGPTKLNGVIVTRLEGGLGHQLFQYAAGRRLALARGVSLLIDRPARDGDRWPYPLEPFNISAQEAPPEARAAFEAQTLMQRIIRRMRGRRLVEERSPRFDPSILDLPGDVYLDGQWQSEQYFADVAGTIRGELSWTMAPGSWSTDLLARIESGHAVSVHVRRGDRVSDPASDWRTRQLPRRVLSPRLAADPRAGTRPVVHRLCRRSGVGARPAHVS